MDEWEIAFGATATRENEMEGEGRRDKLDYDPRWLKPKFLR